MTPIKAALSATSLMALTAPAFAQEVNLYSSRHYDSDTRQKIAPQREARVYWFGSSSHSWAGEPPTKEAHTRQP